MELNQYLSMFIDEAQEHLQALNDELLNLENAPHDISIVHNIFRSAHTLKGMSATMGFSDLASLTHEMENVLDLVRNEKLKMNVYIFDGLFKSLDALESMVQDIVSGGKGKLDVSDIITILQSIVRGDFTQTSSSKKQEEANGSLDQFQLSILHQSLDSGHSVYSITVTVREDCVLKAVRAYMVFEVLDKNGEVVKSFPSVVDIEEEKFDRSFTVFYISKSSQEILNKLIMNISEIDNVQIVLHNSDTLNNLSLESMENETDSQEEGISQNTKQQTRAATASISNRTIRVDIEKLDTLMNLFSELLIDRVRLEQLSNELKNGDLIDTVEHMGLVSNDLQSIVLNLRMVTVDVVFNRFPRMIRDIAKTMDKKVDLVITGADTELDRTVVDEIGDPLVHLLRNAVDHGIESVADRIAVGKSETGTVHLRAYQSGNHVFIEIEEDGRGINRDKVILTALKKGILTEEQIPQLSDEDVFQLLFASGFSTADTISDISGRGVGLDVVKSKISSLGGHIYIDSSPGTGTKFSVQLPLTLSIISAMLIRAGDEKYALPLSSIVETAIIQKEFIRNIHGNKVINYRDTVIPLLSLVELFKIPNAMENKRSEIEVLVLKKADKLLAVQVDEFVGQQDIVLKTMGGYLVNTFAISGATILGDGQVSLIIDPNALFK